MVVMAAILIRQQPTFVELFGDIQNNGKFISIFFFLNYPNRISIFILACVAGGSKRERAHGKHILRRHITICL